MEGKVTTVNYKAYSNGTPCFGLFQVLIVCNKVSNINDNIGDSNSVIKKIDVYVTRRK